MWKLCRGRVFAGLLRQRKVVFFQKLPVCASILSALCRKHDSWARAAWSEEKWESKTGGMSPKLTGGILIPWSFGAKIFRDCGQIQYLNELCDFYPKMRTFNSPFSQGPYFPLCGMTSPASLLTPFGWTSSIFVVPSNGCLMMVFPWNHASCFL